MITVAVSLSIAVINGKITTYSGREIRRQGNAYDPAGKQLFHVFPAKNSMMSLFYWPLFDVNGVIVS